MSPSFYDGDSNSNIDLSLRLLSVRNLLENLDPNISKPLPANGLRYATSNPSAPAVATALAESHLLFSHMQQGTHNNERLQNRTEKAEAGDGAIYSGRMYHHGGAHQDPHRPMCALIIVSFTSRPLLHSEYCVPSLGTTWGTKYNMSGHTLQDLAHADMVMAQLWAMFCGMGLYKLPGTDRGWDYVTLSIARVANLDSGFDDGDYEEFLKNGCDFSEDMKTLPAWLIEDLEKYRSDGNKLF
eukprot:736851-Ditylum_brightwellii.AAC.1